MRNKNIWLEFTNKEVECKDTIKNNKHWTLETEPSNTMMRKLLQNCIENYFVFVCVDCGNCFGKKS